MQEFSDLTRINMGLIAANQFTQRGKLKPGEPLHVAFPKLVNSGLWEWPPRPLKRIP